MRSRIKTLLILAIVAVVILSVLGLVKYTGMGVGFSAVGGHKLMLTLPNLTRLSSHLNGGEYQFNIENICFAGFTLLLAVSRACLLRGVSS